MFGVKLIKEISEAIYSVLSFIVGGLANPIFVLNLVPIAELSL